MAKTQTTTNNSVRIAICLFFMSIIMFISCAFLASMDIVLFVCNSYTNAKQEKQQLIEDVKMLKSELLATQAEAKTLSENLSELKEENEANKSDIKQLRSDFAEKLDDMSVQLDDSKKELQDTKKELQQVKLEIMSLREENKEFKSSVEADSNVPSNKAMVQTFDSVTEFTEDAKYDNSSKSSPKSELEVILNGEQTVHLPLGEVYDDPGISIFDGDIDFTSNFSIIEEGTVLYDTPGYYKKYYKIFTGLSDTPIIRSRDIIIQEGTAYGKTSISGKDFVMKLIPCEADDFLGAQLGDVIEFTSKDGKPFADLESFISMRTTGPDSHGEYILHYQFEDAVVTRKLSNYIFKFDTPLI